MAGNQDEPRSNRAQASTRDAVELAEHLATLTRSGLPLPAGLRAAGAEINPGPVRSILLATANRIDRGEPLGEALAVEGTRFPGQIRALVESGVRSGRLVDVLAEFVRHANLGQELRQGLAAAVAYPLMLLVALTGIIGLASWLATRTVGNLEDILRDFGIQGTPRNQIVLRIANAICDYGLIALGLVIVGTVLAWVFARLTMTPGARRRFATRLPIIGPVLHWTALAEFCHLLALLLEAEVPLPEAIRMAGASVKDADLAEHCQRMAYEIDAGHTLAEAVATFPSIPAGLGQIFQWGEERQALAEALHLAGDLFETRSRSQASYANTVFLAILLLMIANGLGFVALLLTQPIQLISKLSGSLTLLSF